MNVILHGIAEGGDSRFSWPQAVCGVESSTFVPGLSLRAESATERAALVTVGLDGGPRGHGVAAHGAASLAGTLMGSEVPPWPPSTCLTHLHRNTISHFCLWWTDESAR